MTDHSVKSWTLSKWLAAKTYDARVDLIASVNALDLSLSQENCGRLLIAHECFRRSVGPAYVDPILQRMLVVFFSANNTLTGNRVIDQQLIHKPHLMKRRSLPNGLIPRMGWLYASEFVDLGLAQLNHTAQFCGGASIIDYDERSAAWQRFKAGLDEVSLSDSDEEKLVNGARAAIYSYSKYLKEIH